MRPAAILEGFAVIVATLLSACTANPPPANEAERAVFDRFRQDRLRCAEVAERSLAYVDPRDGRAVADRSIRVEADVQRCLLSRGWNDPRHEGWRAGRS